MGDHNDTEIYQLLNEQDLYLCIENEFYREYLVKHFEEKDITFQVVDLMELAASITAKPKAVLLLQSETREQKIIDLSAKLKSLFGNEIKSILLSTDYNLSSEVEHKFNDFIHFPVEFEQVISSIRKILKTSKKILLIDDSKLVHKHLKPILQENGYEVIEAFDGLEGVEKAQAFLPDLIILDVEMPKMNGFEACRAIRNNDETANIYVIMSSTLTSATDQSMGFESGVDEYITKPVDVDELLDRLKKILFSLTAGRENLVLLGHDEIMVQNTTKNLRKQGFTVKVCGTIRETVHCLKHFNAELVLSEIEPIDGTILDLIKHLKLEKTDQKIDLIIITTRDSVSDSKMVLNAGASAVISKPFTNDSLLASVEKTLAERRARIEKVQMQKYVSKASQRIAIEKSILLDQASQTFAQTKTATIFFSDIANFTKRCETYSAEEVVSQINNLFNTMANVIIKYDGDIDKFIGDACMAFWLADDSDKSVYNAVNSIIELKKEVEALNKNHPLMAKDPIHIRMGLNTGKVILCDIGASNARVDLTIIGDAVNIASRLESASKNYGLDHLISEETVNRTNGNFEYRLIDRVIVKGKQTPVQCYQLISEKGCATKNQQKLLETFDKGLQAYFREEFTVALKTFEQSQRFEPSKIKTAKNPSLVFAERCQRLIELKPENWQGVWEFTTK